MEAAKLPSDESERLKSLLDYDVLDTEAEHCFDELTQLASQICEAPIALVSLLDSHRQWFKSKVGLDATETPREFALCGHAILQDEVFEVCDASADVRFFDNPLVTGGPKIRFYAGTPLRTFSGQAIGTLCVINTKPMKLSALQRDTLTILGRQVIAQLELRKRIKDMSKANEAKDEFLSNISHELRTPLNAIVGFSELLMQPESQVALNEPQKSHIKNIDFGSKQLLAIVNSVLDLEKIDAGKMDLQLEPIEISTLINDVLAMMKVSAEHAQVKLILTLSAELQGISLNLDKTKITQVLCNLLSNAIKHTAQEQEVRLCAQLVDQQLVIKVIDQGAGISDKDQRLLFDKYRQVGAVKKEGTGLGLCICKGLLALMGGTIRLESKLGEGTKVSIALPAHTVNTTEKIAYVEEKSICDRHVCVVEDNPLNQVLMQTILNQIECRFEIFDCAERLFESPFLKQFDICFMDINLPGMSGIEAQKKLKADVPSMPVFAVTADIFRERELNSLFDGVIAKPYRKVQIVDVLKKRTVS
ncbi:hybrid sensor histidine kinase/response regulator [Pseudoalteromonas luteoviolacea]|uniref:hybrid sensor histidine kinase/response regulator n=1 Tax=Pseudoalteromonas luteoviolacea TaxID=43657 RepID=UPI001150E636|nr:GAF domain-containing hybrid sensor histidine kinase/response regulator [Pseudoalteromonas luteoviolacea]TQF71191.1 response regulator [Pseudoalteromonas luteoviolacea]